MITFTLMGFHLQWINIKFSDVYKIQRKTFIRTSYVTPDFIFILVEWILWFRNTPSPIGTSELQQKASQTVASSFIP